MPNGCPSITSHQSQVTSHRTWLVALAITSALAASAAAAQNDTTIRIADTAQYKGVAPLVLELRVGSPNGRAELNFGKISELAVADDGTIYVFDKTRTALISLNAGGGFIGQIGHSGQAPGAYKTAYGLAVAPDGNVLLWDPNNERIDVFMADGTALPALYTGRLRSTTQGNMMSVDSAGRVYLRQMEAVTPFGPTNFHELGRMQSGTPASISYTYETFGKDGAPLGTKRARPFPMVQRFLNVRDSQNSSIWEYAPFMAYPWVALTPSGNFVTGIGNRYAFEMHDDAGRVVSVRRNVQPIALTDSERSAARAAMSDRMRNVDPNWTWNGPDVSTTRPVYDKLDVGSDGSIWLTLHDATIPYSPSAPPPVTGIGLHDVFTASGTYVGQVAVPRHLTLFVRSMERIWGVETDVDGSSRVVRYRIGWR